MTEPTKPEPNCSVCGNPQGSQHITDHGHMFYVHFTDPKPCPECGVIPNPACRCTKPGVGTCSANEQSRTQPHTKCYECVDWTPEGVTDGA